jgi:hypothetical protein
MPHPASEGGIQLRALANEVRARGMYRSDIVRCHALLNIAFAGEEDERDLNKRIMALAEAAPEDTPSSFAACCDQFADVVDEVAARWEKDFV